jgi:DNA-binding MarR family transcriptional regulator
MQQDSVDRHVEHWKREIPDLDPLVEGVITRMQMLLRHLHQTRQATLADTYGLEEHEYATLHFLGGCGPDHRATPSEIAAWHKMSPSGITGRLDALEKRGYIRRLPSPTDRRKVIVELTEEGRQAWRRTFDPQTDEETRVLAALTAEEREQLNDMLRRMMRVVDRPGLLTTPRSAESADAATEQRSRFTQPLLPCGARGKAARVSAGVLVGDPPILSRAIRRATAGRSAGPPVGWLPLLQPIQQAMSGQHSGGE